MKIKITIDIFSGRKNPIIVLNSKRAFEFGNLLLESINKNDYHSIPQYHHGYRGISIEYIKESKEKGSKLKAILNETTMKVISKRSKERSFTNDNILRFLLEYLKNDNKYNAINILLSSEFKRKHSKKVISESKDYPKEGNSSGCICAPLYEPEWWNDAGQIQFNNNCYNYSTNYRTNTYAQPGRGSGHCYSLINNNRITHNSVWQSSIRDGLIAGDHFENECPPEGHLVALVVAPGYDYHWYRKGIDGTWSHKIGGNPITNLDDSGNIIINPCTADRGMYTEFCGFMQVMHGHIILR